MIPVVLIDANNSVCECITAQSTTTQFFFWGGAVSITFCYASISFFATPLSFV